MSAARFAGQLVVNLAAPALVCYGMRALGVDQWWTFLLGRVLVEGCCRVRGWLTEI